MEVDVRHAYAVDGAFRLGNPVVDGADILFHSIVGTNMGNPVFNLLNAAVVVFVGMMVMGVMVFALLRVSHINMDMGALNAAFLRLLPFIAHPGNAQGVQLLHQSIGVRKQFQQGGGEHVPRCAHAAV